MHRSVKNRQRKTSSYGRIKISTIGEIFIFRSYRCFKRDKRVNGDSKLKIHIKPKLIPGPYLVLVSVKRRVNMRKDKDMLKSQNR